jgi:hypothetical protein
MLFISALIVPANCHFSVFIACKSRSRYSISRMVCLRKKLKQAIYVGSVLHTSATCGRLYVCIQPTCIYLWYIIFARHYNPHLLPYFFYSGTRVVCCSVISVATPSYFKGVAEISLRQVTLALHAIMARYPAVPP